MPCSLKSMRGVAAVEVDAAAVEAVAVVLVPEAASPRRQLPPGRLRVLQLGPVPQVEARGLRPQRLRRGPRPALQRLRPDPQLAQVAQLVQKWPKVALDLPAHQDRALPLEASVQAEQAQTSRVAVRRLAS